MSIWQSGNPARTVPDWPSIATSGRRDRGDAGDDVSPTQLSMAVSGIRIVRAVDFVSDSLTRVIQWVVLLFGWQRMVQIWSGD